VKFFPGALVVFTAAAQSLSFGVKAGATLTGDLGNSSADSESKRITFGPAVIVGLPHGFGVEVDALYQRVGYRADSSFFDLSFSYTRAKGNSWAFPILLRKTLGGGFYVGAGLAPRTINGNEETTFVQATTLEHTAYQIAHSQTPASGALRPASWAQPATRSESESCISDRRSATRGGRGRRSTSRAREASGSSRTRIRWTCC